jgi:hypothetical protein
MSVLVRHLQSRRIRNLFQFARAAGSLCAAVTFYARPKLFRVTLNTRTNEDFR